jgi:hypothetical protein
VTTLSGITAHVVRMRPGDVLWVRLPEGTPATDADAVREAVMEVMPLGCSVLLTEHTVIEDLGVAPLSTLLQLREVIEQAIVARSVAATTEA